MNKYLLRLKLESDTTFGRGDGVAGFIDSEVEHDENGLPYLRGRSLKGLLQEECANILFSLKQANSNKLSSLEILADKLFGKGGSDLEADAKMFVGDAVLPQDLRDAVNFAIHQDPPQITPDEVLKSLTATRRQTAMSEKGAPKKESLRSMRVVLRETVFESELMFSESFRPDSNEIALLGACVASLRRVGLGRNRGRGKVTARLIGAVDLTDSCLSNFESLISEGNK